ncbi:NUDIX hydrolase [Cytobacillus purgationiresistens]|uniref:8-oxo-dGTP pyrophosphatase MutT (NUDIX family) n=1 Tax=Cytobacillus purgationiresistens TaxID=863449 RepID=A0ABU0AT89_9BACI|nr:CoA pyrophosphatase [Cytobacillus purgationiresistens]MDQ0273648.1 8-oxo-dGTP pyrophosphatase MutT (NUDIX family) [Cytobacillus purgationiresistens]
MEIQRLEKMLSNRKPIILGSEQFARFAVMLPLIEKEGQLHVLFEVRSLQLRRQPGEICFPGGRVDQCDESEKHAAIRETSEELGISENSIVPLSSLDYMISPFNTIIYPFVGVLKNSEKIVPNPTEVEEVFTVPLQYFLNKEPKIHFIDFKAEPGKDFPFNQIPGGENYKWQSRKVEEVFYYFDDKVIWGLTARILQHFITLIKEDI